MWSQLVRLARRLVRPGLQRLQTPRRTRLQVEPLEDRTVPTVLPPNFRETIFASGLVQPSSMTFSPDGRLFVTEKVGDLRVIQNGQLLPTPFLHVNVNSAGERGLLGVAFHPQFMSNKILYVYYTTNTPTPVNRVSRFVASSTNPNLVQPGSEKIILDNIPSPVGNHNGGAIHFGKDGKLYIATGDGGIDPTSPANPAQNLGSLSGKILRLNANGTIPLSNPFVGQAGRRPEIWAFGFRNPFTFAVQPGTGRIFVNDVGGADSEEVSELFPARNYGWPQTEGFQPGGVAGVTYPIHAYAHNGQNAAITGGVFQNSTFPVFWRGYYFADFIQGFIRRLDPATNQVVSFATGADGPVDLDVAPDGSLMYLSIFTGRVYRIQFVPPPPPPIRGVFAIVGSPQGQPPVVSVYNAFPLRFLFNFMAFPPTLLSGVRAAAADLNGDGHLDYVVVPGPGAPPVVQVIDGRTLRVRAAFLAFPAFAQFGMQVALANVRGDARPEVVVHLLGTRLIAVFDPLTGAGLGRLASFPFPGLVSLARL